jgi:hypothetical protein
MSHAFAGGGVEKLNPAIKKAASYLKKKLPNDGSKLAIFSLSSSALENFFVDELTDGLSNITSFNIVDRTQLAAIAKEMGFQLSGEVSDTEQAQIGKKAGANIIISVSVVDIGQQQYRFRVRAINVETARLYGAESFTVSDPMLDSILNRTSSTPISDTPETPVPVPSPPPNSTGSFSNPIVLQANNTWNSQTLSASELWFKVTPTATSSTAVLSVETDGDLDTYLELFDSSQNMLKQNDDDGNGLNAKIECEVPSGRNYTIRVTELDKATGTFRIKATVTLQDPPTTPKTPPATASLIDLTGSTETVLDIELGKKYINRFAKAETVHLYYLEIPIGYRSVRVSTEGNRDISMASITQTGMASYLVGGTASVSNSDILGRSSRGNANITFTVSRSGRSCYILVRESNNKTGNYTITTQGN